MKTLDEVKEIIKFAWKNDIDLMWKVDDDTDDVVTFVVVNDVFFWGASDAEGVEVADIPAFQQAIDDVGGYEWSKELYAARKRGMRPQGAIINIIPKDIKGLFLAAGPVREIDFCNPKEIVE